MSDLDLPPTYREIATTLTARIVGGDYPLGSQLPSARELASEFRVSMATVQCAMGVLEKQGLVVGRQGRGRFVNSPA